MRKLLILLAILISVQAAFSDVRLIMVEGFCYLEGQSEHSKTKVKFIKVSPSAITDSTYTDSSGYFFLSGLYEGIYDLEYTHIGYVTVIVEDQVLVSSTTLPPVTLVSLPPLSGALSGTLGPGSYRIIGDILINTSNSLRLLPGTTFMFAGPYSFGIYGTLLAEGTESDSIVFTTNQPVYNRWRGLRFYSGSSGSRLAYCLIEKGYSTGGWPNNCGGGVYCESSAPTFTNCVISGNAASGNSDSYGGGAYCFGSSATFTSCTISDNLATGDRNARSYGGGIYCQSSSATFTSCAISGNTATGYYQGGHGGGVYCSGPSATFTSCAISGNAATTGYYQGSGGGGVYCSGSSATFASCTISGNSSSDGGGLLCETSYSTFRNCTIRANYGGEVFCSHSQSATFTNCTISVDTVDVVGGGVYSFCDLSLIFTHCTIAGNSAVLGAGVYCDYSSPTFKSTIIAFPNGSGIYFENSPGSQIIYCDIFANTGGNITFDGNNPSHGPPMIGVPLVLNANADSADIYMNIFVDPMFADTAAGDYHLTDFSHCIGAGDPADTLSTDFEGDPRPNPSWSYPDIGADEHWSGSPVLHLVVSIVSGNARLHWTPFGAGPYSIYGATTPFIAGTLLDTVSDTTTWTDEETASRPSRYFYYVMAEWPGR